MVGRNARGPAQVGALALVLLGVSACGLVGAPDAGPPTVDVGRGAWIAQASGVDVSLRGVCAVDARVCWASGADGTVLRTRDGGATWERVSLDGAPADVRAADFRDVHAFDDDHAVLMVAGEPPVVLSTTDGGASWRESYRDPNAQAFFDSIAFWDGRHGLLFGDPVDGPFHVLRTVDAGRSWTKHAWSALPQPTPGEAGFAASGTCIAVADRQRAWIGTGGSAARVLRTSDRGTTWDAVESGLGVGRASAGVFSVAFADGQRGVVVGGDYRDEENVNGVVTAASTRDGGATWQPAATGPRGYRSAVVHVPAGGADAFVAAGPSGTDATTDGGRTWRALSADGWHALAVGGDGESLWAVGSGGRIARMVWQRGADGNSDGATED